ncbi:MAG: alanine:cation symporter family protein [Bacilli bacterium]
MINILQVVLIIIIVLCSIYISYKIGFNNYKINKFLSVFKSSDKTGLFLSLGSKIGVGSIIGTASALYIGGTGSIFWMCLFTLLTSSFHYIESYFGNYYKKDGESGTYYIYKYGLNNKGLAIISSLLLVFTYSCAFLMIQCNTLSNILVINTSVNIWFIFILISLLIISIVLFSLKELLSSLNKLVPIMCLFFIIICSKVLIDNYEDIVDVVILIFRDAFNVKTFLIGSLVGIKRSIFLTELLVGTTSISSFKNNDPKKEAIMQTFSSYFISFVISFLTAFLIIIYNMNNSIFQGNYNILISNVFTYHFGRTGIYILIILLLLFAVTTMISGFYIGLSNLKHFIRHKYSIFFFKLIVVLFCMCGVFIKIDIMWVITDIMIFILIFINFFGLFSLFRRKKYDW